MGGSSREYADYDTAGSDTTTRTGASADAIREMSRNGMHQDMVIKDRKLVCLAKSPVVDVSDFTGSMHTAPQIVRDKWPMAVREIIERKYLEDVMYLLGAVGDYDCSTGVVQMGDFSTVREVAKWFKKVWLAGGGTDNSVEAYELPAYVGAYLIDMPNAKTPVFMITADEGLYEQATAENLTRYFGGKRRRATTAEIFKDLRKNFKDNVFLIHRFYYDKPGLDDDVVNQWQQHLGKERVVIIPRHSTPKVTDLAILDIKLGIMALVGGKSLEEYLQDMRARKQTPERIAVVKSALTPLTKVYKSSAKVQEVDKQDPPAASAPKENKKEPKKEAKQDKKKEPWEL